MGLLSYLDKKYHHIRRYNHIIRVFARYGFEDLVAYLEQERHFPFLKKLLPKKTYEHSLHLTKWQKMRMVAEELGPTFVKFGQLLSNRPDLMPRELIDELEKLQDSVPPLPGAVAEEVILKELGKSTAGIFSSFETEAFASASMAQVHKAVLRTMEQVVVKVQRPGIRETIISDIRIMYELAEMLVRRVPSIKAFDPAGLIRNFEESIMKELDFIHESVNVQRFAGNFTADKHNDGTVRSPRVYKEFTTGKVLTLEFIDGIKISDIKRLEAGGYDRHLIARRLIDSYFRQVFRYGFFHADPHPGNIFVLPGNVVCFIDYGMMGSILRKDLEQLGYLFLSIKSKDIRKIIKALQQLSDDTVVKNYRGLETDLFEFVNNYSVEEVHQNEMSTILLELKDIILKHELKVPVHFFLLARSLVSVEGVARQLDPHLDITAMARKYMVKVVARHYNPLQFAKRILNSVYEMGIYMEDFPRDLKNAIRKVNSGEIKVDLEHKGIDPLVHTLNRISRQVISAVIASALIIGSSLLIVAGVPPKWHNTSVAGIAGFSFAILVVLQMLRDVRKGDHDER